MLRVSKKKLSRNRQSGFVVAAELLLISTILVLGLITGFTKLRDQALAELADTGSAIGAINQSYRVSGTIWTYGSAQVSGFAYTDAPDSTTAGAVGGDNFNIVYAPSPLASFTGNGQGEAGIF